MIISIIKKLFFKSLCDMEEKQKNKKQNLFEPDFIDYDGMGNQGRFPKTKG